MNQTKITIKILTAFLICICFSLQVQGQNLDRQFDQIISASYQKDMPGATFLVAKNGKTIYRKAVGKSNLELDVDMTVDNVFELASISKQFTAISILMLEEQGKLSTNDPITKFIPDYPTNGKTITIHHLLNHTSGIKSYTDMGDLISFARLDKSPKELIDYFKNEPMDFDPGEEYAYNNSGYILLGYIIEVITGDTFENYVETNIFKTLGMYNSRYGSKTELIKKRASGYGQNANGYVNSDYISMSIPYAAGSLMSTVDDMLKWQNALTNNTLIKASSLKKAINGSTLNNGEYIDYGYGLGALNFKGSKGYTHSGGIFGFSTNGIYLIDKDTYVIGLSNCSCNDVSAVTRKLIAAAIGKPFPTMKDAITLPEAKMKQWVGAYEFEDGAIRHIFLKDGKLNSMRESETNTVFEIFPLSETRYMFEDGIEYNFSKTANGQRQVVFITGTEMIGKETDKAMPKLKEGITLSNEVLTKTIGKYALAPEFIIEVTVKDSQIFAQATGQGQFELFAEDETNFFAKVAPIKIRFNKDNSGTINSLTLFQGGREMPAEKIE